MKTIEHDFNGTKGGEKLKTWSMKLVPTLLGSAVYGKKEDADKWPKITIFGDCETRNSMDPVNGAWGADLTTMVNNFFQVDIRGFRGYTSEMALKYMPQLFTRKYLKDVTLFLIFFGSDDAWQSEDFPSVRVDEYESNLKNMIQHLKDSGLAKEQIIVITPGWYNQEDFDKHQNRLLTSNTIRLFKSKEHSQKYAKVALDVGIKEGVSVLDWWEISLAHKPYSDLFLDDGIHLSRSGGKLLFDALWKPLVKPKLELLKGTTMAQLSMTIPYDKLMRKHLWWFYYKSVADQYSKRTK